MQCRYTRRYPYMNPNDDSSLGATNKHGIHSNDIFFHNCEQLYTVKCCNLDRHAGEKHISSTITR